MNSYKKNTILYFKRLATLSALLLILSCMDNPPSDDDLNSAIKPLENQNKPPNTSTRALRIEGAWSAPVNIIEASASNQAGDKMTNLKLLSHKPDSFLTNFQQFTNRDPQTGIYANRKNHILQTRLNESQWSPVSVPDFFPVSVIPSEKMLIAFDNHPKTGEVVTLWRYADEIFLAIYHPENGWNKTIKVTPGVGKAPIAANLKIIRNGNIIVWFPILETQNGLQFNVYQSELNLVSSNRSENIVFETSNIIEAENGIMFVWFFEDNITPKTHHLKSQIYDYSQGWQAIESIKSFQESSPPIGGGSIGDGAFMINSIETFMNPFDNNIYLIYTLMGSENSINSIMHNKSGWTSDYRIDNQTATTQLKSPVITFYKNSKSAALAWVEQNTDQSSVSGKSFQRIMFSQLLNSTTWSIPTRISSDTYSDSGISLVQPGLLLTKNSSLVSWVESGPTRNELFINHLTGSNPGVPELVYGVYANNTSIDQHKLKADINGNVLVVWQQTETDLINKRNSVWSSVSSGQGSLVTPPGDAIPTLPVNPSPLATHWLPPKQIWNHKFVANLEHHIYGPDIHLINGNDAFLSLHKAVGFDPLNNDYKSWQGHVLHKSLSTPWQEQLPFAVDSGNTTLVKIDQEKNTGNVYAVWVKNDVLYMNYYISGQGWQTEFNTGITSYDYNIFVDSNNNVYLYWAIDNTVFLSQYISGSGLQTTETFVIENLVILANPVVQADNSFVISWLGTSQSGSPFIPGNQLFNVRLEPGIGWGEIYRAPRIDSSGFLGTSVDLMNIANNELLAIAQNSRGNLYSTTYNAITGWEPWQNIDYNLDLFDGLLGHIRITSNTNLDVMLTWSEESKNDLGETIYRVYSNSYNPIIDVNGSHWGFPQRIASVAPLADKNLWHAEIHPQIALSNNGQAVAIWIDENENTSRLLVNEYSLDTGWSNTTETLVSYNKGLDGIVDAPRVSIAADDSTLISWRKKSRSEFTIDYSVWVVEKQSLTPIP